MIKLADPAHPSTRHTFQYYCPYCRQLIQVKTRHTHKSVTCPRCQTTFTAQNRPAVTKQQHDTPAPKASPARWLIALLALVLTLALTGAAAFAIYWYLQPQPSPAPIAVEEIEEVKGDLVLKFADDLAAIPELLSPDLSELVTPQPVAPDIPIVIVELDIKPEPEEVEQKPQPVPEQPPTTIQLFGDLTWDDDLLTASRKMLTLTDSKSISVSLYTVNEHSLLSALRRLLRNHHTVLGINKPVAYRDHGWLHIEGYPVIISQGAFQINLSFICEPGYALDHADECLAHARQILGPEADCYLPLRLQRVRLTLQEDTKSRTLDVDSKKEVATRIRDQLQAKYASTEHFTSAVSAYETTWQDQSKHKLQFLASPHGKVALEYERDFSDLIALSQKLRKLQDKIKEKEHQDRFAKSEDRSNKL